MDRPEKMQPWRSYEVYFLFKEPSGELSQAQKTDMRENGELDFPIENE